MNEKFDDIDKWQYLYASTEEYNNILWTHGKIFSSNATAVDPPEFMSNSFTILFQTTICYVSKYNIGIATFHDID